MDAYRKCGLCVVKMNNFRGSECRTFRLAVGAVLVVFLSQHFGQDGLVLLVEFLGLLSLRTGRHIHGFSWTSLLKRTVFKSVVNRKKSPIKDHNQSERSLWVRCENTRNRNPLSAHRNSGWHGGRTGLDESSDVAWRRLTQKSFLWIKFYIFV